MSSFPFQIPWILMTVMSPLVGALLLSMVPGEHKMAHRAVAGLFTGISLVLSLVMAALFNSEATGYQLTTLAEDVAWIPEIGARFTLAVDGISLWLIVLTTFMSMVATVVATSTIQEKVKEFHVGMLVMQAGMLGAFTATDVMLYFLFWEVMLIPMFLLIGLWGGVNRVQAALKFVLYTMVGSAFLMAAILYVRTVGGAASFALRDMIAAGQSLGFVEQVLVFGGMAIAFLIKVPLFPLHTWSPDAYSEAPAPATALLSGVMAKVGVYGLIRFAMPMSPDAVIFLAPYIAVLAVVGIVYGALVAFNQTEMRRVLAYSSLSHLGFVVLGLMALTPEALTGAVFQCVAHGLATGGLFLVVGLLEARRDTRTMADFGGIARQVPLLTTVFILLSFASAAVPGLVGFVGEFLILTGTAGSWALNFGPITTLGDVGFGPDTHALLFTAAAAIGVIVGAVYVLVMVQRIFFGPVNEKSAPVADLHWSESSVLVPLVFVCVALGFFPQGLITRITPAVESTLQSIALGSNEYRGDVNAGDERTFEQARFAREREAGSWAIVEELGGGHADDHADDHGGEAHGDDEEAAGEEGGH